MKRSIQKVAVLGAGTMGARIAAHMANADIPCLLLDMVPAELTPEEEKRGIRTDSPKFRNRLAQQGLTGAVKSKPEAFYMPEAAGRVRIGNFDDNLKWIRDSDWIIEAVVEDRELKRKLLERVQKLRSRDAVVSSNTSGISLVSLSKGFQDDFRRHWLGTHFFNPPRYMKLLELIPTSDTLPDVVDTIRNFGETVLGKGVVIAKDTPNFIANRIGTFITSQVLKITAEDGYTVEEIDALTGPALGLPQSATFRTLDLVGLDIAVRVAGNIYDEVPSDEQREIYRLPPFVEEMLNRNWLGEKTGQGFYRRVRSGKEREIHALDLKSYEYQPRKSAQFTALETARNIEDTRRRVRTLYESAGRAGEFYRKLLPAIFHYAACRLPEITDDIVSLDRALKWGFNWELGLFELFDAVGVRNIVAEWEKRGRGMPELLKALLDGGKEFFYERRVGGLLLAHGRIARFELGSKQHQPIEEKPGLLLLRSVREAKREVRRNTGASLLDLGDGALCLEFHSKMNTLGADALEMVQVGVSLLEKDFEAMVIGNEAVNFSAGANLMLVLVAVQEGEWEEIDEMVRTFQGGTMALQYASKPVVAAPFGLTLGGGLEMSLHAARIHAAAECYMGLVEPGVGLVPAGGGTKEMVVRATETMPPDGDPLLGIKNVFEAIGMGKVSTSAEGARGLGFLRDHDGVTPDRDRLIGDAKQIALGLARGGYRPPSRQREITVYGEPIFSALKLELHLMHRAQYISDHDVVVGTHLARILSGDSLSGQQTVSEQYLLDLEREAFLSLTGEAKTLERIQFMLKKGKPLRN